MDEDEELGLLIVSCVLPIVYIIIGIPLALKLIEPNGTYGIRTSKTLENPELWYSVNFVGGVLFVIVGFLSIGFIYLLHRHSNLGPRGKLFASLVVSIFLLTIAITSTFIFL